MSHLYLGIAILAEVVGTSALKASATFTRPLPSLLVVVGFGIAFIFLTLALREIPVGVAYAIWSGVGLVLILLVSAVLFGETPDVAALLGVALIVAGVAVIHLGSRMAVH